MDFKFEGRPLTQDEMEKVLTLILQAKQGEDTPLKESDLLKEEFLTQVILKRIEAYELPFMISSGFFVASLITGFTNPGKIMILLWLAFQYSKKDKKSLLDINDWCNLFPWGVPTDEEMERMWDSQKAPGAPLGNLLDDVRTWKPSPI